MVSLPSELIREIALSCELSTWLMMLQTNKLWYRRLSQELVLRSMWSKESNTQWLSKLLTSNRVWNPLNLRHLDAISQSHPEFWMALYSHVWIIPCLLSLPQSKEVIPILEEVFNLALPPTNIGYSNYLPLVREAIIQGKEKHLKLIISRLTDDNLFDSLLLWASDEKHAKLLRVVIERLGPPPRSYIEKISKHPPPDVAEVLSKYGIKISSPKKEYRHLRWLYSWFHQPIVYWGMMLTLFLLYANFIPKVELCC